MSIFQDIHISWGEKNFKIPSSGVMRCLAKVEQIITLHELNEYAKRGTAPQVTLAMAYGEMLRFAGARVTDEEVMEAMFSNEAERMAEIITTAVKTLQESFIPQSVLGGGEGKKSQGGGSSSRKRTKPASKKSGSAEKSSGDSIHKSSGG